MRGRNFNFSKRIVSTLSLGAWANFKIVNFFMDQTFHYDYSWPRYELSCRGMKLLRAKLPFCFNVTAYFAPKFYLSQRYKDMLIAFQKSAPQLQLDKYQSTIERMGLHFVWSSQYQRRAKRCLTSKQPNRWTRYSCISCRRHKKRQLRLQTRFRGGVAITFAFFLCPNFGTQIQLIVRYSFDAATKRILHDSRLLRKKGTGKWRNASWLASNPLAHNVFSFVKGKTFPILTFTPTTPLKLDWWSISDDNGRCSQKLL